MIRLKRIIGILASNNIKENITSDQKPSHNAHLTLSLLIILVLVVSVVNLVLNLNHASVANVDEVASIDELSVEEAAVVPVVSSGAVKYNCELSDGEFVNGACVCDIEEEIGQTQESMYDNATGFCQSTFGGPAGDAFNASTGLPHGAYEHWNGVMVTLCTDSGGTRSGAACICGEGTEYSMASGMCEAVQ